jgi:hypothetical protein
MKSWYITVYWHGPFIDKPTFYWTCFPDRGFRDVPQFLQANLRFVPRLCHSRFLPNPFQFVFNHSSYPWILYSQRYRERRKISHNNSVQLNWIIFFMCRLNIPKANCKVSTIKGHRTQTKHCLCNLNDNNNNNNNNNNNSINTNKSCHWEMRKVKYIHLQSIQLVFYWLE